MIKTGSRKFTAFLFTIVLYSIAVLFSVFILKENTGVLPSLAFQLASAYGILCGLFFGSNVLEHYSRKGADKGNEQ